MINKMTFEINGSTCTACDLNGKLKIVGDPNVSFQIRSYNFFDGTAKLKNGQTITAIEHVK